MPLLTATAIRGAAQPDFPVDRNERALVYLAALRHIVILVRFYSHARTEIRLVGRSQRLLEIDVIVEQAETSG